MCVVSVEYATLTETAPHITIIRFKLQDIVKIFNGFVKVFLCPKDSADSIHGGNRPWIGPECMFICSSSLVEVANHFEEASYESVRQLKSLYLSQGSDLTNL
jgi:hypothetical protein